jgi:hypothetical protein
MFMGVLLLIDSFEDERQIKYIIHKIKMSTPLVHKNILTRMTPKYWQMLKNGHGMNTTGAQGFFFCSQAPGLLISRRHGRREPSRQVGTSVRASKSGK